MESLNLINHSALCAKNNIPGFMHRSKSTKEEMSRIFTRVEKKSFILRITYQLSHLTPVVGSEWKNFSFEINKK